MAARSVIVFAVLCSFVDRAGGQAARGGGGKFLEGSCSEKVSDNGKFRVRLEQPLPPFPGPGWLYGTDPAPLVNRKIQVFDVNGPQPNLLWSTTAPPGNTGGGLVSNDGRYVAIVNRSQDPSGDVVEVFCRDKGKTVAYRRDEIARLADEVTGILTTWPIPDDPDIESSYAFRIGSSHAIFRKSRGRTRFCLGIWDGNEFHWLVWDAETAQRLDVNEVFAAEILEDAHRQSREQTIRRQNINLGFLVKLRRPEDRPLIEGLLDADDFQTMVMSGSYKKPAFGWLFEKLGIHLEGTIELDYVYTYSSIRSSADWALGRWEGKGPCTSTPRKAACHRYLGNVLVDIALPAKPKHRGGLWVYLVPQSVSRTQWSNQRPVHYLNVQFGNTDPRLKPGRTISCAFSTAAPGSYWVKAVWDKAKPYHNGDVKFYKPQKGDYESVDSPVIDVKAGQTVDVGVIQCKQKVKGK